ncbi:FecR family protein [Caulobacter soli]|uniref:FecR family protein n=1 Tax=Caulobacter soli TaxID=2708539 RepID=UPI0013EBC98A|nr:FecR domain-containing protein [Caulobacter soli]
MVRDGKTALNEAPDRVLAEAALWLVRDKGRAETKAEQGRARWMAEDPVHEAAYARTLSVWDDLGQVAPDWKSDRAAPGLRIRARELALACLVVCVCALGLFAHLRDPDYTTRVGEQRTVQLDDGTRVTLNTGTRIVVRYSRGERHIRLDHGEAYFDVAHNAARPFFVDAGHDYVRALGTVFIVRNDQPKLEVTLLAGAVQVGSRDAEARGASVILAPGDRLRRDGETQGLLDRPSLDTVTAWRQGELVLENTPLLVAVGEMNRYTRRPIQISVADAAGVRLSGVFKTGDSDAFVATLAALYGFKLDKRPDALVLSGAPVRAARS